MIAPDRALRPRRWWAAVGMCLVGLSVLLTGSPADAHALVKSTFPADGAVLDEMPREISLVFNEGVSAPTAALRIHGASAGRIDDGGARVDDEDPTRILVEVPADHLGETGTFVVTWRAVSLDGHPVRGAWLFSVGEDTAGLDDDWVEQLFASDGDLAITVLAVAVRVVGMAGALLLAGIALFGLAAPIDGPRQLGRLARAGAWAAFGAALLSLPLQAMLETGLGVGALGVGPMGDVLAQPVGWSAALRAVLLALVLLRWRTVDDRDAMSAAAASAALLTLVLDGHSMTESPVAVIFLADLVHLLAAATWSGGLVALLVLVRARRRADDPVGAAQLVAGFSRLATWSLLALVVAGSTMGWVTVRAARALTSTSYGWTLLAKLAIVAVAIVAGLHNNRRLVPAVVAAADLDEAPDEATTPDGVDPDLIRRAGDGAWRRLRTTLAVEAVAVALAVAATAVLVGQRPASQEAGVTGAYTTFADLGDELQVNVVVDPNRAGVNEIHLYLLQATGRPASSDQVTFVLEQPELGIGPLERTPSVTGPGHWSLAGRELAVPGEWLLTVIVRTGRFSEERVTIDVVVNP